MECDVTEHSLQAKAKWIRIGEQLETPRVLLELVEDNRQSRIVRCRGAARCGTRSIPSHNEGWQLNDQLMQRDPHNGWIVLPQGDLGVDRRVTDLTHTQEICAVAQIGKREMTLRVREDASVAGRQHHNAERQWLPGLGYDDRAADRLGGRGLQQKPKRTGD